MARHVGFRGNRPICEICGSITGFVLAGSQARDDGGDLGVHDPDDFPAGRLAAEHEDAGPGKTQPLSEESAAGGVGGALHRRRGETQRYPIGQLGHQLILRGAGLHVDGEEDVRPILTSDGWVGSHFCGAGLSGIAASKRS